MVVAILRALLCVDGTHRTLCLDTRRKSKAKRKKKQENNRFFHDDANIGIIVVEGDKNNVIKKPPESSGGLSINLTINYCRVPVKVKVGFSILLNWASIVPDGSLK